MTKETLRARKVESLKIEIERLQRLLSSSASDGVTVADCNIRLEKALEEYQRTPEHALVKEERERDREIEREQRAESAAKI